MPNWGSLRSKRMTSSDSFGSGSGWLLCGSEVNHFSTVRAIAHVRCGSAAGGIVIQNDLLGTAGIRQKTGFFFAGDRNDGRMMNRKAVATLSGASTVLTVYWRGPA
jgi:hypothetical protein